MSGSRVQRAHAPFTPPRPSTAGLNPLCLAQRPTNLRDRIFMREFPSFIVSRGRAVQSRLNAVAAEGEVGAASGGDPDRSGVVHPWRRAVPCYGRLPLHREGGALSVPA